MAISAGLFDWPLPEPVAKEANRIRTLADAGRRYEVGPDLAKELLALLGLVRPFWVPDGVWLATPERVGFWDNQGACQISSPLPTPPVTGFRLSTFSLQRVLDERTQLWLWTGGAAP